MLALLRESTPILDAMLFEMPPTLIMAMVLFAVQIFANETNAAILNYAPLLELTFRVIRLMI